MLSIFPELTKEDVRITIGVENGSDIKLSALARQRFGYAVECKNREIFTTLYSFYDQAAGNEGEPLVVIKMNNRQPMVLLDAEYFFSLIKDKHG